MISIHFLSLGFHPFKLYICQMRLISYLVLTIIGLTVFNEANGSTMHRSLLIKEKMETFILLSEQESLTSLVFMIDRVHLFQRSGRFFSKQPGQWTRDILFLAAGREIKTSLNWLSIAPHFIPISILLIFPKHYFF